MEFEVQIEVVLDLEVSEFDLQKVKKRNERDQGRKGMRKVRHEVEDEDQIFHSFSLFLKDSRRRP